MNTIATKKHMIRMGRLFSMLLSLFFVLLLYSVFMWFGKRIVELGSNPVLEAFIFHNGIIAMCILFVGLAVMLYVQNLTRKKHEAIALEKIQVEERNLTRVLINMEIITMLLRNAGFELETAENGQIAIDMLVAGGPHYYDAILMDIQMPAMDGYTATRNIRALEDRDLASVPIIALTANALSEDIETTKRSGM